MNPVASKQSDIVTRGLLRHFLAALAYRTQKALRDAPPSFADYRVRDGARTPRELVRHMASVLGYARTYFVGGVFQPDRLDTMEAEVERFHSVLADLSARLGNGDPLQQITYAQLLQGPFADAMTHAGQIAMLRRLSGSPVPAENFIFADVSAANLTSTQALPAAPDRAWLGRLVHRLWVFSAWLNRRTRKSAL